jgi:hypothetical protein
MPLAPAIRAERLPELSIATWDGSGTNAVQPVHPAPILPPARLAAHHRVEEGVMSLTIVYADLFIENVIVEEGAVTIAARVAGVAARCPTCGAASRRVHGRYRRAIAAVGSGPRPAARHGNDAGDRVDIPRRMLPDTCVHLAWQAATSASPVPWGTAKWSISQWLVGRGNVRGGV